MHHPSAIVHITMVLQHPTVVDYNRRCSHAHRVMRMGWRTASPVLRPLSRAHMISPPVGPAAVRLLAAFLWIGIPNEMTGLNQSTSATGRTIHPASPAHVETLGNVWCTPHQPPRHQPAVSAKTFQNSPTRSWPLKLSSHADTVVTPSATSLGPVVRVRYAYTTALASAFDTSRPYRT